MRMKLRLLSLLLVAFVTSAMAGEKSDCRVVEELLRAARNLPAQTNRMLYFGKELMGTPYVANTLETEGEERLVVNLRQMDCMTFVENVLALTVCDRKGMRSYEDFCEVLKSIRYRDGKIDGYASRLHYFSDWMDNNTEHERLVERTRAVCDVQCRKLSLDYMSTHSEAYPVLKDNSKLVEVIRKQERKEYCMYYIPKHLLDLPRRSLKVKDGDIIALTTNIKGQDVVHLGIACWVEGKLHLLHASMKEKQVILDKQTLFDYMAPRKSQLGIRVASVL